MKLSHALDGFWLSKRLDFSTATIQNYERVFREFLVHLGNREMEAITSDDIRRYLDYLHKRRKLSKRSVQSYWAILSNLWTWRHLYHLIHLCGCYVSSKDKTDSLRVRRTDLSTAERIH